MKIAITGGIGSGKSYVCRMLEKQGIRIYDCDEAAKRLMRTSEQLKRQLTELVGPEVYADGRLVKLVMTRFLLASEANQKAVNAIVHPAVAEDFRQSGYDWMECAILFESGFDRLVDRVVCVTAPTEVRVQRIMERDGITRSQAEEWLTKQLPQEEVSRRSDFVIVNDGVRDVSEQIEKFFQQLK